MQNQCKIVLSTIKGLFLNHAAFFPRVGWTMAHGPNLVAAWQPDCWSRSDLSISRCIHHQTKSNKTHHKNKKSLQKSGASQSNLPQGLNLSKLQNFESFPLAWERPHTYSFGSEESTTAEKPQTPNLPGLTACAAWGMISEPFWYSKYLYLIYQLQSRTQVCLIAILSIDNLPNSSCIHNAVQSYK